MPPRVAARYRGQVVVLARSIAILWLYSRVAAASAASAYFYMAARPARRSMLRGRSRAHDDLILPLIIGLATSGSPSAAAPSYRSARHSSPASRSATVRFTDSF